MIVYAPVIALKTQAHGDTEAISNAIDYNLGTKIGPKRRLSYPAPACIARATMAAPFRRVAQRQAGFREDCAPAWHGARIRHNGEASG